MKMMMVLWYIIFFSLFLTEGFNQNNQPNNQGFISIDCGIGTDASYYDPSTGLLYVSDAQFTDAGTNVKVSSNYINSTLQPQYQTVRSFPTGNRSCYTLPNVTRGQKYYIRASFMYGNYDGLNTVLSNQSLQFDLHIGVNPWMTVNITDASQVYWFEVATLAPTTFIWICLVNTGHGTPFISILEIRPLAKNLYPYVSDNQSIAFEFHLNYGPTNQTVRYPDDKYDRIWVPRSYDPNILTGLSTTDNITIYPSDYEAPLSVLQTAVIPANNGTNITFLQWSPLNPNVDYVFVAFYSNVQIPRTKDWRSFSIFLNGKFINGPYLDPPYLQQYYAFNPVPLSSNYYSWTFSAEFNSTLPPIINALEVFSVIPLRNSFTDFNDVAAITNIKTQYQIKRNWEGDPCGPQQYSWNGVNCSYLINQLPKIVSLDLSSSGLKGSISESFSQFSALQHLDLSCNNLTGAIPDSLATITYLQYLNLAGNSFTGSVPSNLKKKSDAGILKLIISPTCNSTASTSGKSNKSLILILSTAIPASVVAIITVIIIIFIRKKPNCQDMLIIGPRKQSPRSSVAVDDDPELNIELRNFTYSQLKSITNDFSVEIGRGGFGTVYLGKLDNSTQVAAKVSSQPTAFHMTRQFLTEVRNLLQVHHKNLVSLIGYCKDRDHLALIYEYMPQGSLHDHIRGKFGISRALNWGERLRIAHDAAQGLHYLHTGCNIIHRDVKTSNILLGNNLEAKIADFGLSKMSDNSSPPTFSVVGTLGYIDPESHRTQSLNEKSDVYSFGVVLLELVTGELPVVTKRERVHIVEHVKGELAKGNIDEICDAKMKGEYDTYSVWKVLDLAMRCTAETAAQRPKMAEVAAQLDESLQVELNWRSKNVVTESSNSGISGGVLSLSSMGPSAR